jgi:hypothetical protein
MPSTLNDIRISSRTAEAKRAAKLAAGKAMLQDWRDVGPHTTSWTADRDDHARELAAQQQDFNENRGWCGTSLELERAGRSGHGGPRGDGDEAVGCAPRSAPLPTQGWVVRETLGISSTPHAVPRTLQTCCPRFPPNLRLCDAAGRRRGLRPQPAERQTPSMSGRLFVVSARTNKRLHQTSTSINISHWLQMHETKKGSGYFWCPSLKIKKQFP